MPVCGARGDVAGDQIAVQTLQAFDHRPAAARDFPAIDDGDRSDTGEGSGNKGLAGAIYISQAEIPLARDDAGSRQTCRTLARVIPPRQ
jgi:hypothetical protein